jgi:hypothetical protein
MSDREMTTSADLQVPYAGVRAQRETADQLRARIPGWGADLDPADRPSYPQEIAVESGAHWVFPPRQATEGDRERSIEHAMLPPVFGDTVPLRGASGAVRRLAYRRFSEGKIAHWLLLIAGDRIDMVESSLRRRITAATHATHRDQEESRRR